MLVVQLQLFLGIGRLISNPPGDNRTPIAKRIKNVENQSKLEIRKLLEALNKAQKGKGFIC